MVGIKHLLQQVKHELFLLNVDKEIKAEAKNIRQSQQAIFHQVAENMDIPTLDIKSGSIVGLAMVKNEADIIESTVRNLFQQGVDSVLIVDNGSSDGTVEIIEALAEEYPIFLGCDRLQAYEQSAKMTFLFDQVKAFKPGWIIPFDADEFWLGKSGALAEVLTGSKQPIQFADIYNAFPTDLNAGEASHHIDVFNSDWNIDTVKHHDPKVAFKPWSDSVIEMGNHNVLRPGKRSNDLAIIHFPWRSVDQFQRKVVQGARALSLTDIPEEKGQHWRTLSLLDDDSIKSVFLDLIAGTPIEGNAWNPKGSLVPLRISTPLSWKTINPKRDS